MYIQQVTKNGVFDRHVSFNMSVHVKTWSSYTVRMRLSECFNSCGRTWMLCTYSRWRKTVYSIATFLSIWVYMWRCGHLTLSECGWVNVSIRAGEHGCYVRTAGDEKWCIRSPRSSQYECIHVKTWLTYIVQMAIRLSDSFNSCCMKRTQMWCTAASRKDDIRSSPSCHYECAAQMWSSIVRMKLKHTFYFADVVCWNTKQIVLCYEAIMSKFESWVLTTQLDKIIIRQ